MKKPLFIIFNDTHLKPGNETEVLASIVHLVAYAQEHKIKNIVFAGDLFDSRSNQRLSCLLACNDILALFSDAGITLYLIPGNHDKTKYNSFESFLEIYSNHPNVIYNDDMVDIEIGGKKITLLPFFSDDIIVPMIEAHDGSDILISHFEMNGSTHLGRVSEKSTINRTMLKKWNKVYLGHYHNYHEINKDIVHLPSIRQTNFGEDDNKGFSVIFDDLSYEIVPGKFNKFIKIDINLDSDEGRQIPYLIKKYRDSSDIIRFVITGTDSQLKSLDKSQFAETGIDIKIKYESCFDFDDLEMPELVKKYDKNQVTEDFKDFCKSKNYDVNYGLILLNNFFNGE